MKPVTFYCATCTGPHFGFPAITRGYPDIVFTKITEGTSDRMQINDDVCRILYPKPKRNFVRANLDIPIIGEAELLQYGLWVELTEHSFALYQRYETMNVPIILDGWLANEVPDFPGTRGIPVKIETRSFPLRPLLIPVVNDNDLWRAFDSGMEDWEAQIRMELSTLVTSPLPLTIAPGESA